MELEKLKSIANELPKTVKGHADALIERMEAVIEGIGDEPITWRAPLLRLVQGTTDRSSIPKGTAIGDMLLGEKKMETPLKFIPLRAWEGRQYWDPDPNENRILCSSPDAKLGYVYGNCKQCKFAVYDEEAKKSECTKTKNIMAITHDLSEVFQIVFSKTNYKTGMELESLMKKAGVAPYRRVYGLVTKTNAAYKNVENYAIEILGDKDKNTPEEYLSFVQELFTKIGEDRKHSIDLFYENVEAKRIAYAQQAIEAPKESGHADAVVTVAKEGGEAAEAVEVSPMAKHYTI